MDDIDNQEQSNAGVAGHGSVVTTMSVTNSAQATKSPRQASGANKKYYALIECCTYIISSQCGSEHFCAFLCGFLCGVAILDRHLTIIGGIAAQLGTRC